MSTATGTRRRHFAVAFADLRSAAQHLTRAETTWAEVAPGMKAQSLTPTTAHSTPYGPQDGEEEDGTYPISDPTGMAAVSPSPSRRDEEHVDQLLRSIVRQSAELVTIVKRWAIDKPLKAQELQELALQGDPGCEVVARVERPDGVPYWEPEYRKTDFGGLLNDPIRVGSWAYSFVSRNRRLPTVAETTAHCEGRRVMVEATG